jgi:membrane protein implicated in regulation of membrane protease activity
MHIWFWAWLLVAAVIAVVAALTRDRFSAPWAVGAAPAAGRGRAGVAPRWQWAAFLVLSSVAFVAVNRVRYVGRHARDRSGRPGPGRHASGRNHEAT